MTQAIGWLIGILSTAAGSIATGLIVAFFNKHKNIYLAGSHQKFEEKVKPIINTALVPIQNTINKLEETNKKELKDIRLNVSGIEAANTEQTKLLKAIQESLHYSLKDQLRHALEKCLDKGYKTYEDANNIEGLFAQYEKTGLNGATNSLMRAFEKLPYKRVDNNVKIEMTKKEYEQHKKEYFNELI